MLEGLITFIGVLLVPIALVTSLVLIVIWLTTRENRIREEKRIALEIQGQEETNWNHPPGEMILEIPVSKGMTLFGMLMASALLGFGIAFCLISPVTALVLGWWTCIVGLIFLVSLGRQLLVKHPIVVVTTECIQYRGWPFRCISWSNVIRASLRRVATRGGISVYLNLELNNEKELTSKLSKFKGLLFRLNRLFGVSTFSIGLTPLKASPKNILAIVENQIRFHRKVGQ